MKLLETFFIAVIFFISSVVLVSCNKNNDKQTKPYQVSTTTSYRISPVAPTPIVIKGTTYLTAGYFPGWGTGTATDMSTANIFFNQLAYSITAGGSPAGSVSAPVVDITGYPVTGAPLPLLQTGDFSSLPALITSLSLTKTVNGKVISTVIYDNSSNAIYISVIDSTSATTPVSAAKINFSGKGIIAGGHGKFKDASGNIDYSGYFNPSNPNDAQYNVTGVIEY